MIIGLQDLYYANITEAADETETYAEPILVPNVRKIDLSAEVKEGELYGDNHVVASVKEFKNGKLTLETCDLSPQFKVDITGAKLDSKGVYVAAQEDIGKAVAIGFRANKANGKFRYTWLYKVKFAIPTSNYQTGEDGVNFQTPTVEGNFYRRNKADASGKHPWKAEVDEDGKGVDSATITTWFSSVYEPDYTVDGKI